MITDDGKRWHYLAVRSLTALLRGITSNHHGDFYCLNCFHSYTTNNKLKKQEYAIIMITVVYICLKIVKKQNTYQGKSHKKFYF